MSDPLDKTYAQDTFGRPVALEKRDETNDGRRFSPSAGRNKAVISDTFAELMPHTGHILEIGSGTGEHGVEITSRLPGLHWTFTDYDHTCHSSIAAWMASGATDRLNGPVALDAAAADWGAFEAQRFDGFFCANTIHISPFAVATGIFASASRLLTDQGKLLLYGPFARNGDMSEGNARFDSDLKRRDPSWGVRDLERDLVPLAEQWELALEQVKQMPANNLSVVWRRA